MMEHCYTFVIAIFPPGRNLFHCKWKSFGTALLKATPNGIENRFGDCKLIISKSFFL